MPAKKSDLEPGFPYISGIREKKRIFLIKTPTLQLGNLLNAQLVVARCVIFFMLYVLGCLYCWFQICLE